MPTPTIDLITDDAFSDIIIRRNTADEQPIDLYDEAVRSIGAHRLRNIHNLRSINFPNVTQTGNYSCYECPDLENISLANCVTVYERSFQNLPKLTTVYLPKVQSLGQCAFAGSQTLWTVADFPALTTIYDLAFYGRTNITSLNIPKAVYLSSSSLNGMSGLTSLILPKVVNIYGSPFSGCTHLQELSFGSVFAAMPANLLQGTPSGIVVNFPFEEGRFTGAPWGNADAVINYNYTLPEST